MSTGHVTHVAQSGHLGADFITGSARPQDVAALEATGATWRVDRFVLFHDYVKVVGWIRHPTELPTVVALVYQELTVAAMVTPRSHGQVQGTPAVEFDLHGLTPGDFDVHGCQVLIALTDGSSYAIPWSAILEQHTEVMRARTGGESSNPAHKRFLDTLRAQKRAAVLEIGSRARSGVSRRQLFPDMDYLGIDIIGGENVDVVGDAHDLSTLVGERRFDGVYCIATFEHLLMPWKVALEINRVLRPGGLCFALTHQTLGMHDMPWDFWRYSNTAWHGLFNRYTGFEVLEAHLQEPLHIVPMVYTDHWQGHEQAVGYARSSVLARKTDETTLHWDVPTRDVAVGSYPE